MELPKTASARIDLLRLAADRIGGNAALGRALGYRDGAFVGQMLRGDRPITEKTLRALSGIHSLSNLLTRPPTANTNPSPAGEHEGLHINTVPPLKTVEEVMGGTAGEEYRFELLDDALAPEYPRGLHLIVSSRRAPRVGRPVLVRTVHGELHARIYAQDRVPGVWRACATSAGYVDLGPEDGAVIGTYCGVYEPE